MIIPAGWERYSFGIEDEFGPEFQDVEADAIDTGFRAGLQLSLPFRGLTGVSPFLLGGLLYYRTEIEIGDEGGSLDFEWRGPAESSSTLSSADLHTSAGPAKWRIGQTRPPVAAAVNRSGERP